MPSPAIPLILLGAALLVAAGGKKAPKKESPPPPPDDVPPPPGYPGAKPSPPGGAPSTPQAPGQVPPSTSPGIPQPGGGPTPAPPAGSTSCVLDVNLPDHYRKQVEDTLALLGEGVVAARHAHMVANAIEAAGYPYAAKCIRDAIPPPGGVLDQPGLPGLGIPGVIPPMAPTPGHSYTIKGSPVDAGPWLLAHHMTGDGNRAPELEPLNPALGGYPFTETWQKGVTITLPADWV